MGKENAEIFDLKAPCILIFDVDPDKNTVSTPGKDVQKILGGTKV